MSESVNEELLAELAELRRRVKDSGAGFSSCIHVLSSKPLLKIAGVLISEGIWKGIKYDYEELKKVLAKFNGLPLKVQHGKEPEFKDRAVGKITKVKADDLLRSLVFEAEVTDEKAAELVKSGVLDAVSIAGGFDHLEVGNVVTGRNYNPIEVSLTGSPACEFCNIFNVTELERALSEKPLTSNVVSDGGVIEMSEEMFEVKPGEFLVVPDGFEELEEFSEFEFEVADVAKLSELAKAGKEAGVAKVPPGKYPKSAKKAVKVYGKPSPYYEYPYYYYYGKPKKKGKLNLEALEELAELLSSGAVYFEDGSSELFSSLAELASKVKDKKVKCIVHGNLDEVPRKEEDAASQSTEVAAELSEAPKQEEAAAPVAAEQPKQEPEAKPAEEPKVEEKPAEQVEAKHEEKPPEPSIKDLTDEDIREYVRENRGKALDLLVKLLVGDVE